MEEENRFKPNTIPSDEKKELLRKSIIRVHRHIKQRNKESEFEKEVLDALNNIEKCHQDLEKKVAHLEGILEERRQHGNKVITILSGVITGLISLLIALIASGLL